VRLRRLYRRLFGKELAFKSSVTELLVRELELQEAMKAAFCRKLLEQQPEFHNKPGRPTGSKTKTRRKPLDPETEISKAARRQRKRRSKKA
jgi:hypothetical protein